MVVFLRTVSVMCHLFIFSCAPAPHFSVVVYGCVALGNATSMNLGLLSVCSDVVRRIFVTPLCSHSDHCASFRARFTFRHTAKKKQNFFFSSSPFPSLSFLLFLSSPRKARKTEPELNYTFPLLKILFFYLDSRSAVRKPYYDGTCLHSKMGDPVRNGV